MIKLCIYENNKNSFKVGDKVCSKPTSKNPANIKFCGTIIDMDKNGLCTIECADGTVIDNINPNRIVYNSISENYYCESLTMKSLEKLLFKFIKTNPNIEMYDSYSNEAVNIYSYGKTDYITLAKEFAKYLKQNNPSEAENIKLIADAMYDDTYAVICSCGKRKSVYFNFSDNTNDNDDSDIYVEYTYVLD